MLASIMFCGPESLPVQASRFRQLFRHHLLSLVSVTERNALYTPLGRSISYSGPDVYISYQ